MIEHHQHPDGMASGSGYSHAVVATGGRVIAIAGQVAMDEHGEPVGVDDPRAQAQQVFQNLLLALAAAGATFADVIKLTVFVTDMAFLPAVREVRNEHLDVERPPASTAVQVGALFRPEYLVEIDALAVVGA